MTRNKIAVGHAQVVYVTGSEATESVQGFHIFFDKLIPGTILASQVMENAISGGFPKQRKQISECKNTFIRMIRHELAHVEDESNQRKWTWFDTAFDKQSVLNSARYHAYRMWEEFYACKRSAYFITAESVSKEITELLCNLDKSEEEICELRWKYNTQEIDLNDFVSQLHAYIRTALIYCCYFMGHAYAIREVLIDKMKPNLYSSRFYPQITRIWKILINMSDSYPGWCSPEIFDDLAKVVIECIESFEVYPRDQEKGIYYSIPVKRLYKKSKDDARCEDYDMGSCST